MTLYRIALYEKQDGSRGFQWHTSKASAERSGREHVANDKGSEDNEGWFEIERVRFAPTLKGIWGLLTQYATHPDNG